jgi:23S rRNA (cytidine1920-2'-O)/16S rRNA (cytidine1409-2'-O)-methyltransferase
VTVDAPRSPPRAAGKLAAALGTFAVPVAGRACIDVGASTGGFTHTLIQAGARRVYAVDAGYGQLLGSLRAHPRVVNLERTNLGALTQRLVPEIIEVITIDISYLALAEAATQLEAVAVGPGADLIALVKPMYELRLAAPPTDPRQLGQAVELAATAFERSGWWSPRSMQSPIPGRRGALEFLLHLRRPGSPGVAGRRRASASVPAPGRCPVNDPRQEYCEG